MYCGIPTNSRYRSYCSEITTRKGCDFLNKLREDHSTRNKIYTRFARLLSSQGTKEDAGLISVIEALSFALNSAELLLDENNTASGITFINCLLSSNPKNYGSLVVKKHSAGTTVSDTLKLADDRSELFNGLMEIIY